MTNPAQPIGLDDLDDLLNSALGDDDFSSSSYDSEDGSSCSSASSGEESPDDADDDGSGGDEEVLMDDKPSARFCESHMADKLRERARQRRVTRKKGRGDTNSRSSEDGDTTDEVSYSDDDHHGGDDHGSENSDDSVHLQSSLALRRVCDGQMFEPEVISDDGDFDANGEEDIQLDFESEPPNQTPDVGFSNFVETKAAPQASPVSRKTRDIIGTGDLDDDRFNEATGYVGSVDSASGDSEDDSCSDDDSEEDSDRDSCNPERNQKVTPDENEKVPGDDKLSASFHEQLLVDDLKNKARQRRMNRKLGKGRKNSRAAAKERESIEDVSESHDSLHQDDSMHRAMSLSKRGPRESRSLQVEEDDDSGEFEGGDEEEEVVVPLILSPVPMAVKVPAAQSTQKPKSPGPPPQHLVKREAQGTSPVPPPSKEKTGAKPQLVPLDDLEGLLNDMSEDDLSSSDGDDSDDDSSHGSEDDSLFGSEEEEEIDEEEDNKVSFGRVATSIPGIVMPHKSPEKSPSPECTHEQTMVDKLKEKARQRRLSRKKQGDGEDAKTNLQGSSSHSTSSDIDDSMRLMVENFGTGYIGNDDSTSHDSEDDSCSYNSEEDSNGDPSNAELEQKATPEENQVPAGDDKLSASFHEQLLVDDLKNKARQRRMSRKLGRGRNNSRAAKELEGTEDISDSYDSVHQDDSMHRAMNFGPSSLRDSRSLQVEEDDDSGDFEGDDDEEEVVVPLILSPVPVPVKVPAAQSTNKPKSPGPVPQQLVKSQVQAAPPVPPQSKEKTGPKPQLVRLDELEGLLNDVSLDDFSSDDDDADDDSSYDSEEEEENDEEEENEVAVGSIVANTSETEKPTVKLPSPQSTQKPKSPGPVPQQFVKSQVQSTSSPVPPQSKGKTGAKPQLVRLDELEGLLNDVSVDDFSSSDDDSDDDSSYSSEEEEGNDEEEGNNEVAVGPMVARTSETMEPTPAMQRTQQPKSGGPFPQQLVENQVQKASSPVPPAQSKEKTGAKPQLVRLDELELLLNDISEDGDDDFSSSDYDSEDDSSYYDSSDEEDDDSNGKSPPPEKPSSPDGSPDLKMVNKLKEKARQRRLRRNQKGNGEDITTSNLKGSSGHSSSSDIDDSMRHLMMVADDDDAEKNSGHHRRSSHHQEDGYSESSFFGDFGEEEEEELPLLDSKGSSSPTTECSSLMPERRLSKAMNLATTAA